MSSLPNANVGHIDHLENLESCPGEPSWGAIIMGFTLINMIKMLKKSSSFSDDSALRIQLHDVLRDGRMYHGGKSVSD
jgi:ABC-type Mn2+/Zn2+ transport system permease subunit